MNTSRYRRQYNRLIHEHQLMSKTVQQTNHEYQLIPKTEQQTNS